MPRKVTTATAWQKDEGGSWQLQSPEPFIGRRALFIRLYDQRLETHISFDPLPLHFASPITLRATGGPSNADNWRPQKSLGLDRLCGLAASSLQSTLPSTHALHRSLLRRILGLKSGDEVPFAVNKDSRVPVDSLHRRHEKIAVAIHNRCISRMHYHCRIHFLYDCWAFDRIA